MGSALNDLRFAVRVALRHPGISLIAVVSIALGIGVTSTMFSLVDGMFLRPLPIDRPDQLLWLATTTPEGRNSGIGWPDHLDIRKAVPALADVAVQNRRGAQLDGQGEPETVLLTIVSDNFFPLLGVRSALGRLFDERLDSSLAAEPAIAISDSLWRRRFGGDPALIGRGIRMNRRIFTVVGVLPAGFRGLDRALRTDIWVPAATWKAMGNSREFEERGGGGFEGLARLRPGASIEQARAQVEAQSRRFQEQWPGFAHGRRLTLSRSSEVEGEESAILSRLLLAVVVLTVIISCANVGMLLLAQAEGRTREISIRLSVGAGRGRLVRQLMTESALLAATGTALALLAAAWLIPLLPAIFPPGPDYTRLDCRLDARVLTVTLLTAILTVFVFGLAPALAAARVDLMSRLKGQGRSRAARFSGRDVWVILQAALCVVLLSTGGLLTRSFLEARGKRIGFDTDRNSLILLTVLPMPRPQVAATCDLIVDRLRAAPGVMRAAYCRRMPLAGSGGGATREVSIPGREGTAGGQLLRIRYNQTSVDYPSATGQRLVAGRLFTRFDGVTAERVALVNQTMARQFWQDGNAIDRQLIVDGVMTRVVGVVEDGVVNRMHEPPEPFLWFPFAQSPVNEVTFVVEGSSAAPPGLDTVRREMKTVLPSLVVLSNTTLAQHMNDALYNQRIPAALAAGLGLLGMSLAAAGLFGVILEGVNRRYRELGLRMALGACPRNLVSMVLRRGVFLAVLGALPGALGALAAGRLISSRLFGVSPYDPVPHAVGVAAVAAMSLTASLYPAWRATRVDAAAVLRAE